MIKFSIPNLEKNLAIKKESFGFQQAFSYFCTLKLSYYEYI